VFGGCEVGLEHSRILPDRLVPCVAGHLGELAVHVLDRPLGIGDEHGCRALVHREGQPPERRLGTLALDGVADDPGEQLAFNSAFHEVILCSRAHRLERHRLIIEPRDHDDRLVRGQLACPLEGRQPIAVGEPQVEQDDVHGGPAQTLDRALEAVHPFDVEVAGRQLSQHLEDQPGVPGVVLDQQHANRPDGGSRAHGSLTISSQNCSIAFTARRNWMGSMGLVT